MTHEHTPGSEATAPEHDHTLPNAWEVPVVEDPEDAPADDDVDDD